MTFHVTPIVPCWVLRPRWAAKILQRWTRLLAEAAALREPWALWVMRDERMRPEQAASKLCHIPLSGLTLCLNLFKSFLLSPNSRKYIQGQNTIQSGPLGRITQSHLRLNDRICSRGTGTFFPSPCCCSPQTFFFWGRWATFSALLGFRMNHGEAGYIIWFFFYS